MTSPASPRAAVSIVVNTYNGALYLNECIASILALKGPFDLEIIVIDDASTDETRAVVSGFRDPRIRFLRHEINRGAAAAINTAFAVASGEFIARIDYDDRYLPEFLVRAVAALQEDPAAGLVCGAVEMIDTHGQRCGHASPTQHGISIGAADHFVSLLRHNFITAPTILGRATAWRTALPVPDGLNFADWYMSLKMAEISKNLCLGQRSSGVSSASRWHAQHHGARWHGRTHVGPHSWLLSHRRKRSRRRAAIDKADSRPPRR